jgi:hypothetical protein
MPADTMSNGNIEKVDLNLKNDNIMKKNYYPIFVCLVFAVFAAGCYTSVEQHGCVIEIDLTKTYSEQEYVLQNIAEVSYLPLETRDDFLIDGTISYMDIEQIVVKSRNSDHLFFFDRNTGTALKMLSRKGRSGHEYNRIDAFALDRKAEEVFVLDASQKRVLVYGYNQNFKRSFEVPSNSVDMLGYDDASLLVYIEHDTISKPFLLISKENGFVSQVLGVTVGPRLNKMQVKIGDMVTVASMRGASVSFVLTDDGVLVSDWACDTLYCFNYQGFFEPIAIRNPSAGGMKPCWRLHLTGNNNRFVFFLSTQLPEMWDGKLLSMETRRYAYDRQEQRIIKPRFVLADDPTGAVWSGGNLGNQYGAYMTYLLRAEEIYASHREGKLQGHLNEIAATVKEDDNPVLMLVKFNR